MRARDVFLLTLGVLNSLTIGSTATAAYPYEVIDLGLNVSPAAVNNRGEVVGGGLAGFGQAFRWTYSGGIEYLGTLGGQNSWANDISDAGVIVGANQVTNQPERAFKWTANEGMQQLQLLGNQSVAWAVNESGAIAGLHVQGGNMRACYWDSSGVAQSAGGVGTSQQQSFRGLNESGSPLALASQMPMGAITHSLGPRLEALPTWVCLRGRTLTLRTSPTLA